MKMAYGGYFDRGFGNWLPDDEEYEPEVIGTCDYCGDEIFEDDEVVYEFVYNDESFMFCCEYCAKKSIRDNILEEGQDEEELFIDLLY